MKDYPESAKNFSNALAKAHKARNNYLQFQASEGLGAINYHMGRYGEAVSYFKQALEILNEIRQDTGIPRERVMEKLSDAEEALQMMKAKQRQRDHSRAERGSLLKHSPSGSSLEDNGSGHGSPGTLRRRLSPEFEASSNKHTGTKERPSLTERRGVGFLPPIEAQKPSKKHAVPRKRSGSSKTHLPPLNSRVDHTHTRGGAKLQRHDSLDAEVKEYLKSYQDEDSSDEADDQGHPSPGLSGASHDSGAMDSGEHLRVFSRHARKTPASASPEEGGGGGGGSRTGSPRFEPVTGGCLALGPNTRQLYTTETRIIKKGRKKREVHEIVPITPAPASSPGGTSPASPIPAAMGTSPPTNTRTEANRTTTSNQSKICVIL